MHCSCYFYFVSHSFNWAFICSSIHLLSFCVSVYCLLLIGKFTPRYRISNSGFIHRMQYLIYILTFIPFIICAPLTVQQGVLSYNCPTPYGKPINIPLADTKAPLRSACALSKNKSERITNFPKSFKPGFSQKLSATSATGKYYIYPVNPTKYRK